MLRQPSIVALLSALLLLLVLSPVANAQQLIDSSLPACAQTCSLLLGAQRSCLSNPSVAQSCWCTNSDLAPLKNGASSGNLCAPQCGDADFQTIANWYKGKCAGGANAAAGSPTPAAGATPTTAVDNNSPTTSAPPAVTGTESGVNQNLTGQAWWNTHWQWILMLIILIIGFTAIGVGARIWYRRHHRKVNGEIVEVEPDTRPPDMGMWAPSRHSVHDFTPGGGSSSNRQQRESTVAPLPTRHSTRKGKEREGSRPAMPGRSPSQRLKAAMEQVQM